MHDSGLRVARHGAAVRLTLDRPERRNALSVELRDAISDAIDAAASDPEVKVVVITGTGSVFCSGFDLGEFGRAAEDAEFSTTLWTSSDRYHCAVRTCPIPTIAAINGPAIAGGFDLAMMCDLRVAARSARFAHPERTFGDVVYGPLHDVVGGGWARELTIGGRGIDATEALAIGLVGEVVDAARLAAATEALVERVCSAPRAVLMRLKDKALRRAGVDPVASTLDL